MGDQEARETPMNEHGFGMKHALATADGSNSKWYICTRDDELYDQNIYAKIKAPYTMDGFKGKHIGVNDVPWPGTYNTTGTFIKFTCSKELFNTVRRGLRGNFKFETKVKILSEDIGFNYSNIIKENYANITLQHIDIDGNKNHFPVAAVEPDWEEFFPPSKSQEKVDLGNGEVLVKDEFGVMKEANYHKYYKRNMSSSGVELRFNGRLITYNIFKEIWEIEKHNSYNYLLIRLDLISEDSGVCQESCRI